jgi:hypothetical protein
MRIGYQTCGRKVVKMVDVTAAFKDGLASSVADEVGSGLYFAWMCEAPGTPKHFLLPLDSIARHLLPPASSCDVSEWGLMGQTNHALPTRSTSKGNLVQCIAVDKILGRVAILSSLDLARGA